MSTDELSSGPGPSGRPWLIAALACVAVLAALALFNQTGGHAKADKPPQVPQLTVPTGSYQITLPPPAPSQPPGKATTSRVTRSQVPPSTAASSGAPAFVSSRLDGVTAPIPKGVRLLLGGDHPTELGGNPRQFGKVPIHEAQAVDGIVPVKNGFVVVVEDGGPNTEGAFQTAYWVRPDGRATLIAKADIVIPALAGDRIFAYRFGTAQAALDTRVGHLNEVTLAGRVLASHALPSGLAPLADTAQGLVFSDQTNAKVEIRDRSTLAVRKDIAKAEDFVVVDHGWLLSTPSPSCKVGCHLTVQNIATGTRYRVAIADNLYINVVAVNPNGRSVAISYFSGRAPGLVMVADLASGATEQIPGVVIEIRGGADLAWTPDGGTLAISVSVSEQEARRIALWPTKGGPLKVLPGVYRTGSTPSSLAAF